MPGELGLHLRGRDEAGQPHAAGEDRIAGHALKLRLDLIASRVSGGIADERDFEVGAVCDRFAACGQAVGEAFFLAEPTEQQTGCDRGAGGVPGRISWSAIPIRTMRMRSAGQPRDTSRSRIAGPSTITAPAVRNTPA